MKATESIKKFKTKHPALGRTIDRFRRVDEWQTLIFLKDGRTLLYGSDNDVCYGVKTFESINDLTEEEYRKGVGNLIKDRLLFLGMKQGDLVDGCDYGRNAISSYINGKTTPNIYILEQIASVLSCDVKDLLPEKWVLLD